MLEVGYPAEIVAALIAAAHIPGLPDPANIQNAAALSIEAIARIRFQGGRLDILYDEPVAEREVPGGSISRIQVLNSDRRALFNFKSENIPQSSEITPLGSF